MAWLTRFNPKARNRGERDIIALIFIQYFFPRLETFIFQNNFCRPQGFSTRNLARGALQELLDEIFSPLEGHLSRLQEFNNIRNAEVVCIGISKELDKIIWSGSVTKGDNEVFELERLSHALDNYFIEVGLHAVKAAQSRAVNMSVDAVTKLFESTSEVIARHRKVIGNPYGRINQLWPHNCNKNIEEYDVQQSALAPKVPSFNTEGKNLTVHLHAETQALCPQCGAACQASGLVVCDSTSVRCPSCNYSRVPSSQNINESTVVGSYYSASKIIICSHCRQAHSVSPREPLAKCSKCGAQLVNKDPKR